MPASVGSTRRPERSRSCWPTRCSSDRICRLTAGCVTPSWSAACEKLRRSTTAQKAASCFVSISTPYSCRGRPEGPSPLYDRRVPDTTRLEDTLVRGYRQLALETPARPRDVVLRALDVLLSSLFLLLSLPLSLAIALLVLVTSGTPVFYRGERVGRGARVFTMYKFRTLRRGAEARLGAYLGEELVSRTQAEFTTVGRWLKATQLDEIPQFVNVLRGDMSLVGPRPIRPVFFEGLAHELPSYWQRLVVRPGLTGFAQVRRGYETSMGEKLAHDLEWIADRSVRLYLLTVVATGWRVLKQSLRGLLRRGA